MTTTVTAETVVKPSEDEGKVQRCLLNLFPSAKPERIQLPDGIVLLRARGTGLKFMAALRNLIRQERIRTAARSILRGRTEDHRIRFYINKQAAFVSRISFCESIGESPLGSIEIIVETDSPQDAIDYLAGLPRQRSSYQISNS